MSFPWVSRELYDRVCADLKESREERLRLLDRIIGKEEPLALSAIAAALPDPGTPEAESMVNPATGQLKIEDVRRIAQEAANRRMKGI